MQSSPSSEVPSVPARRRGERGLAELLYRLRAEGDTPVRQALSVGVGVLVGCLPLYGTHLPLSLALGRLLRLNRVTMYLATHVSNPFAGPFLLYSELQVGSLLRRGSFYPLSIAALRQVRLTQCLGDLVVGSVVVGLVLGTLAGAAVLSMLHEKVRDRFRKELIERTARPYLDSGYLHWEYVRAKLRHDPVYLDLIARGLLPAGGRLLDLGCGRGVLLALLDCYRSAELVDGRPADWAAPPADLELVGLEGRRRTAAVARRSLAGRATVRWADLGRVELPPCTAATLLDVLHELGREEQDRLLARVRAALEPGGVLVIREVDGTPSLRFAVTTAGGRARAVLRGRCRQRFCYRSTAAWREALEALGFDVRVEPASRGTRLGTALLVARLPAREPAGERADGPLTAPDRGTMAPCGSSCRSAMTSTAASAGWSSS